jgi:hypothetical protein
MRGKDRYRHVKSSQTARKEDRPLIFSGVLGVTTGGENQVEVNGRPGFVWVRLRNQLNELIQAFNEEVAPVFDLPVRVIYDSANPIRYKVIGRDVGRYTVWVTTNAAGDTVPSTSSYLPAHGASHSFNKLTGVGGGDVVWVYSDQFIPWLVTPSGSSGANSVSVQPSAYYYDQQFRWAGGTGIAGFDTLLPTGSSNARMLLVYLDPDTGTPFLATGTLTEFANTITGTADIMPYMPSLIEPTDIPLAGVRLITGSSVLLWQNLYDLRDYFAHSSVSGTSSIPENLQHIFTVEGTLIVDSNPLRIYNNYGENKTISEVFLSVDTPPTDASILVDVNKDGTTIFTTQSNRPSIADGANTGNTISVDVPVWADGEYLTMDVDQIGSGTAGSYLTVHIIYS